MTELYPLECSVSLSNIADSSLYGHKKVAKHLGHLFE